MSKRTGSDTSIIEITEYLIQEGFSALREGIPIDALVVVLFDAGGRTGCNVVRVLDLRLRKLTIKQALVDVPDSWGFVLMYDGSVEIDGHRMDALMTVAGLRDGAITASAIPYGKDHIRGVWADPPLRSDQAAEQQYRDVFSP